jgi:2,6-dihydroxypyridine 3-monooxygenase
VDIYERAGTALEDRGAGIVVLPITEKYFAEQSTKTKRVSLELTNWTYLDRDGSVISTDPDRFHFSGWGTMYRALLDDFGRDRYHYDHEVVGFEQTGDSVSARFTDDSTAHGDLLIFADGFSSTGRSLLLPEVEPQYAGYVAWRGVTPEIDLSDTARADLDDSMVYQVLSDGHFLAYAIPDGLGRTDQEHRIINFVWYRNYPLGGPFEDLMLGMDGERRTGTVPPGLVRDHHMSEMRATAAEVLAPSLLEVVNGCDLPLIQAVFDLESSRMAFDRVCLIGDAATTLRPHIAAGQAKACADAWALRDALVSHQGDVMQALASWEPTQLALAHSALSKARAMGTASQFEGTMRPGDPSWKFGLWEPGN